MCVHSLYVTIIIIPIVILHQCTQVCALFLFYCITCHCIRLFYFLWQIAKAWLDPVTANKFILLPPNQLDKLKVQILHWLLG